MKIEKRDGRVVDFDNERVTNAIEKAMLETVDGVDKKLSRRITDAIRKEIESNDLVNTVEDIQDLVEKKLMASDRKDIAKKYILYRELRNQNRGKRDSYTLLDNEFISKYKKIKPPMQPLGEFVYYRTYSRWLPEERRREYWWETCRRAVEFNCKLLPNTTKEEAQQLFDNLFNLRQFLSGRTLWTGYTKSSFENKASQFNCSFAVIDSFDIYKDICYLLMLGVGVGFSVERKYVSQLPKLRANVNIMHKPYTSLPKYKRKEVTDFQVAGDVLEINVGDSKNGWSSAIDLFLKVFYLHDFKTINTIIMNYDSVRPFGETLKTFGGKASGHDALLKIIDKTYKIITKNNIRGKQLTSIDAMDIANIIAEGIVVGGVRRSAQMCLFDHNDNEMMNAKSSLYTQDENGIWSANQEIIHRMMSNNSIAYYHKPDLDELRERFEVIKHSAEGNFFNMENALKRNVYAKGSNPCFSGDMKLLTTEGYKTFEELDGTEIYLINSDGDKSLGKVWCSGEKEVVNVKLTNGNVIRCTPDHVFQLNDGSECFAKDLAKKRVKMFINKNINHDELYVKLGFIQGDGSLGRLNSDTHKGLEIHIGNNDNDILDLFNLKREKDNQRSFYVTNYTKILQDKMFDGSQLPERVFPLTYNTWTHEQKASFLRGCYSANGSVIKQARVAYKTTCKVYSLQLQKTLKNDFEIDAYITTNRAKLNKFDNGEYLCKESYDINISKYNDIIKFYENIGFIHSYKNESLQELLMNRSPYVVSVKGQKDKIKVYDFSESLTNWGVVEGVVVHNCGEIILDTKSFCNLTTLNVMAFVENGQLNKKALLEAQKLSARAGYRMANVEVELPEWNKTLKRDRLLGCSLTGWQDMVNATTMSIDEQNEIARQLRRVAREAADEYAELVGENKPLLVTTLKPEGTQSLLPTVSAGLHFSHSPYYVRRIRINSSDPLVKVCEELEYPVFPEVGQDIETCKTKVIEFPVKSPNGKTKYDVSAIEQLEIYKMFMENYVDHNASNTISVRPNEWNGVIQWVYDNWDIVIGITFISLDDSFYQLLPYESITEEEYNRRSSEMKPFIPSLLSKYEIEEIEIDTGDAECTGGVCPIR